MSFAIHFTNPFDLDKRDLYPYEPGITVADFLQDNKLDKTLNSVPIVVIYNAEELLADDYATTELKDGDVLALVTLPGALSVGAILAIIAIVIVIASTAYFIITAPDAPDSIVDMAGSPTYSIASRNNRARLGHPKPVVYGDFRVYPDLSAQAYTEYENDDDQVLYQLFEVSQGEATIDVAGMRFEDTLLTAYGAGNYEVEVLQPGETSTIYPSQVIVSNEVDNLEMLDVVLGPFAASDTGQLSTRLSFDVVAPAGIYNQNPRSGTYRRYTVRFKFEARDLAGGSWFDLGTEAVGGPDQRAFRRTYTYAVAEARYEVRTTRLSLKQEKSNIADTLVWGALKAFLVDDLPVTTTTRAALWLRASEKINNKTVNKFNCVCQRKIPTWSSGGGWTAPVLTSNPAWIFADIIRADYGGRRADTFIDLLGLEQLATVFDNEGLEFNGTFDTESTVWEALQKVSNVCFCAPVDKGGVISMIRDSEQAGPTAMFSMRNIIRDSFNISFAGIVEETSNAINGLYYDKSEGYREVSVEAALSDSPADVVDDVQFFGVTDRDQAFKLGMYITAQNLLRREIVSFDTAIEGYIPTYGDQIAVSHYVIGQEGSAQYSGEVIDFDNVDVITVTEDITGLTLPYILLRNKDGSPAGPYQCALLANRQIRITEAFDSSGLVFEAGYERPHFTVGEGQEYYRLVKITSIQPQGGNRVTIEGFVDDPAVYDAADGISTPGLPPLGSFPDIAPSVTNLEYELIGTTETPQVRLSWDGKNADYYIIEASDDSGTTYVEIGRSILPQFEDTPDESTVSIIYRVAAVNLFKSPYTSRSVTIDTSSLIDPDAVTSLVIVDPPFVGPTLKVQWDSDFEDHRIDFKVGASTYYSDYVTGTTYELSPVEALGRSFDVEVYSIATNGKVATSSPTLSVSNPAPAVLANINVTALAGNVMITFTWPTDTDIAGISAWSDASSGFTPSDTNLVIDKSLDPVLSVPLGAGNVTYIKIAGVDVWGDTGLNYSGQYQVTGKETVVDLTEIEADIDQLQIDMDAAETDIQNIQDDFPITETNIADNAISTPKLQANSVIADKILANTITGDKLLANTIGAREITAESITSTEIKALTIQGGDILGNTISADKLVVTSLDAITANMGTLTAGTVKTQAGTGMRVEVSSSGSWPIWCGTSTKNATNGRMYFDTSGNFVIKDSDGTVIMSVGPGSNQYIDDISNAYQGWSEISDDDGNKPANNADVTANNAQSPGWLTSAVPWSSNKITSSNIGGFFNSLAITTAYIGNAAITNAKIGNLAVDTAQIANGAIENAKIGTAAVDTLEIQGNAVTIPMATQSDILLEVVGKPIGEGGEVYDISHTVVNPDLDNSVVVMMSMGLQSTSSTGAILSVRLEAEVDSVTDIIYDWGLTNSGTVRFFERSYGVTLGAGKTGEYRIRIVVLSPQTAKFDYRFLSTFVSVR